MANVFFNLIHNGPVERKNVFLARPSADNARSKTVKHFQNVHLLQRECLRVTTPKHPLSEQ